MGKMKVFMPVADGFEDIEAMTVVDVLRRAGITIDIVGVPGTFIRSRSGVRITVDKRLQEVNVDEYDGVIIPGGNEGVKNLSRSISLLNMIKKMNAQGKLVGAICAAPLILAKIGVLDDKRATIYPGLERELTYPRDGPVVVDKNVITSQGPGTAMDFALKLVEVLAGKGEIQKLKEKLIYKP